jgi:hypothetical protein
MLYQTQDPLITFEQSREGFSRPPLESHLLTCLAQFLLSASGDLSGSDASVVFFLVEPNLEHIGGVFEHGKSSKVQIWVTADEACIPVRVKSEVIVGSFVAELISVQGKPPARTSPSKPLVSRLSRP